MQTVIIRLVNNDRVIGQLVENSYDVVGLYAPMIIKTQEEGVEKKSFFVFMPYDTLSDTCLMVFENTHVLTVTHPKTIVEEYYNEAWVKYYPDFKEYKKMMMKEMFDADQEAMQTNLTDEKLKNLFSSFMEGIDKKKLN